MSDDVLDITIDAQAALASVRGPRLDAPGFPINIYSARELAELELPRAADPVSPHTRAGMITLIGGLTGHGKTTWAAHEIRQAADAGRRTLVLDLEQHLVSLQRLVHEAGLEHSELVDYAPIPEGLSLERRADQLDALEHVLAAKAYDLLVVDPFYKLHTADSNEEVPARELVGMLRGWIAGHGFAILTATHCRKLPAGRTTLTIDDFFGSSVFTRDPELVLAIQRFGSMTKLVVLKSREPSFEHGQTFELLFDREKGFYPKPTVDPDERAGRLEEIGRAAVRWIAEHPGEAKNKVVRGVGSGMKAGTDLVKEALEAQVRSGALPAPVRSGRGALRFYPLDHAGSTSPGTSRGQVGSPAPEGLFEDDLTGARDLDVVERAPRGQVDEAELEDLAERLAGRLVT